MKLLKRFISFWDHPKRAAWFFVLPALIIFFVFIIVPMIGSIILGFFSLDNSLTNWNFVGLGNFQDLMTDDRFWNSLKNTFFYAAIEVPLNLLLSLSVALYLQKNSFWRKTCRTFFFVPNLFSLTAVGITWKILLDRNGAIAQLMRSVGLQPVNFLNSTEFAMPTIIGVSLWFGFGFNMILFVSGLQSISPTYYEAARIDGASSWQQFRSITLPLLVPTLSFCLITHIIRALQVFAQPYVMTDGGPLFKTETVLLYMYSRGFRYSPFDIGYASAITEILFVIIVVLTILMYRFFLKREVTEV